MSGPAAPKASGRERAVTASLLVLGVAMSAVALLDRFGRGAVARDAGEVPLIAVATQVRWESEGHRIGPSDAAVKIVEFGNFTCSACRAFHLAFTEVRSRYPQQVSLTWLHFVPGSGGAVVSARDYSLAAECAAEQGVFEGYMHAAFGSDPTDRAPGESKKFAIEAGLADSLAFESCVREGRAGTRIDAQSREAERIGLTGTPTWFLNGRMYLGSPTVAQLDSLVVQELRPASPDR